MNRLFAKISSGSRQIFRIIHKVSGDQPGVSIYTGKNSYHTGSAADLPVQPFQHTQHWIRLDYNCSNNSVKLVVWFFWALIVFSIVMWLSYQLLWCYRSLNTMSICFCKLDYTLCGTHHININEMMLVIQVILWRFLGKWKARCYSCLWWGITLENFMHQIESYMFWCQNTQINPSLRELSPT